MRQRGAAWHDAKTVSANAAGRLASGQREMVLGDPVGLPRWSLLILSVGLVIGGVLAFAGQVGPGIGAFLVFLCAGLATMSMNLDTRRRWRELRASLVTPRFGHGYGEVLTDPQGGVEIRSGTARIGLGLGAPAPPEPGRYHLFWLEHDPARDWDHARVLLSAEPVPAQPPDDSEPGGVRAPHPDATTRTLLAAALQRTESELADNRAGALSPPQRRALTRSLRSAVLGCVTAVVVAAGLVAVSAVQLADPKRRSNMDDLVGALIPAFGALVTLVIVAVAAVRLRRRRAVLRAPAPVMRATGPVTVRRVGLTGENDLDWRLTLGQLEFDLTTPMARAFFAPGAYTLYYLPAGSTLLNAEPGSATAP